MIKIDTSFLEKITSAHGLVETQINSRQSEMQSYLKNIHSRELGFYKVIDDLNSLQAIKEYSKKLKNNYKNVVVLAIGGSSLGTICMQNALLDLFANEKSHLENNPKLHVIDNIDPSLLAEFEETLDLKNTLFIVVTKSGGTPETLAQYLYFKEKIIKAGLKESDHMLFITDPEKGLLRRIANENREIKTFEVPSNVGGRFSVLTPVSLLPAAIMGLDIESLISGARKMRDAFLSLNPDENLPFKLATIQYLLAQKSKNICVTYVYEQKLIRFADWYRQLLGESIGKRYNDNGQEVHVGITPVSALGVTDQHSQNQLYNEGPNDKFFLFIVAKNPLKDMLIPFDEKLSDELGYLKNVSFATLLKTEMRGTMDALIDNQRPLVLIEMDKINEENLGELFMLFECATAFLGEFFQINAFDQPGVELAKQLTKQYLIKNK